MTQDPISALIDMLVPLKARHTAGSDRPVLRKIVGADAQEMLCGVPSSARSVLLSAQVEGRLAALVRRHPLASTLILSERGHDVGLCMLDWPPVGPARIVDLTLLPAARGRGLGTGILLALCRLGDITGRTLRVGIFYDNPACRLLVRAGFHQVGGDAIDLLFERPPGSTT